MASLAAFRPTGVATTFRVDQLGDLISLIVRMDLVQNFTGTSDLPKLERQNYSTRGLIRSPPILDVWCRNIISLSIGECHSREFTLKAIRSSCFLARKSSGISSAVVTLTKSTTELWIRFNFLLSSCFVTWLSYMVFVVSRLGVVIVIVVVLNL